ncbi:23S rRNA (guanosine(2251)-2'-O)-methyltransferase RlmB [Crassaminicella profunda]|uniref:23S rRNA (guanosine(2251)-2'-O)-methyltransferase RlmB n=1 Tax=Crassaminicella profunda TaxID=1286698 RepID=UPI001CA6CF1D|nr:23S rRNA (guanosine(2251)-2'-O)-methyltransferase RlmB [Crassaminicella profunda]QZY56301.1 23S rRNA (guanosine(2251)-2'-O)-methyltransferase RlmB [Crassaminicella profunda]
MILKINSSDNGTIKHVRELKKRKYRQKYEEYIVEGIRIIRDALQNNKEIKYILFAEELYTTSGGEELLHELMENNIKIYEIPNNIYMHLSDTQNPQGIMAVLPIESYHIDEVIDSSKNLFLVLDRVQDPGNLGTIIRTADAAGINAVILTKGCVDLYNLKTIRSTMGSIFHFPIVHGGETIEIIKHLKSKNIKIVSTSLETDKYYDEVDYNESTAFVIGNEANGVLKEVLESSDELVKIPMIGKAESLNASIAASIIMYEAVRQKRNQKI